jgi:hypothetical protein
MSQPIVLGTLIYIVFCILVGVAGSQRRMGFTGTFILSILVTPVVMLVVLLLTGPSQRIERHRRTQND